MAFKFEKLEVWQLAVEYADAVYRLAEHLPTEERYGLWSQITRAANSVALNIAEGSTGQTDPEQSRFVGIAVRSLVETVACLHLIRRRGYVADLDALRDVHRRAEKLFAKLQAFRTSLRGGRVRDEPESYDPTPPF